MVMLYSSTDKILEVILKLLKLQSNFKALEGSYQSMIYRSVISNCDNLFFS